MKFVRSRQSIVRVGDILPIGSKTGEVFDSDKAMRDILQPDTPTSLEDPSVAPGDAFPLVEPEAGSSHPVPGGSSSEAGKGTRPASSTEMDSGPNRSPDSDVPRGVAEVVHPSGIRVFYQAAPKRLYKVNGKEVPSVTTVLDVLEKGGLSWWGMKVGVDGVRLLVEEAVFSIEMGTLFHNESRAYINSADQLVDLLTKHKLTVNHVRDSAGARGQSVHDALEVWAEKGIPPQPSVYAEEERGYVTALCDFLIDSGVEPVASEVMVGSAKHKYAGRYDLRGKLPAKNAAVVVKTYPKRKPLRSFLVAGEWLLDVKTSKGVYDTHYMQLEAYEEASKECGYEPTIARGVIHLTEDGRYELVRSKAVFADFKAVLGAYRALEKLKAR